MLISTNQGQMSKTSSTKIKHYGPGINYAKWLNCTKKCSGKTTTLSTIDCFPTRGLDTNKLHALSLLLSASEIISIYNCKHIGDI